MTSETWEQVKTLFNQAAGKTSAERRKLLSACNEEIRAEVESLLAIHERDNAPLEQIIAQAAAELKTSEFKLAPGRTLGQYRIERELGRGGMGEVYLVRDTRFGRLLALKTLPSSFNEDQHRPRRFEQEARAIFALNHPNIITIHETGEVGNQRFIVTEYVDGETLRDIIVRGERDLLRLVKIGIQVAEALVAAHNARIIHRDIKPENIMVRRDGYVKVLDFGLAKPTEEVTSAGDSTTRQFAKNISTAPGLVLGTVNYMSPEQARGYDVDSRTDIFSLGVVLYEAITGRPPFIGDTRNDVLIAIAGQEPLPLAENNPELPAEMRETIDKALRKNREERYQTIEEMLRDLESVRDALTIRSHGQSKTTSGIAPVKRSSSAEYIIGEIKRNKLRTAVVTVILLLLIAIAGVGVYKLVAPSVTKSPLLTANLQFTKITTTGKAAGGVISPDGRYVIFGSYNEELVIRQMATGSSARLLPPDKDFGIYGCTFTPDSNYVDCWQQERAKPKNSFILRIPVLPGQTRKIVDHVTSAATFSPNGKQMAFLRYDEVANKNRIIISDSDGNNQRLLAINNDQNTLLKWLAWSPDGKIIAAQGIIQDGDKQYYGLFGFRVDDGAAVSLGSESERWRLIRRLEWLPDGSGLMMTAIDRVGGNERIWLVSYPNGESHALTNEISTFGGISISADGSRIVASESDRPAAIWRLSGADVSRAKKLTSINGPLAEVAWTPDGRIVYGLANDLWIMADDGSDKRQLTFGQGVNRQAQVSIDGRYVVFSSSRAGDYNIWRLDLVTGELKQLTTGGRQTHPVCTPDGQSVIYKSRGQDKATFWRIGIEGGEPTQIGETNLEQSFLAISPDGKLLAYQYRDGNAGREFTAILSIDDGVVRNRWPGLGLYNVQFSSDSRALLYTEDKDIWMQPIAGGPPKRLTSFTEQQAFFFSLSRDGKNFLITRGDWTSDVVMINVK